METLPRRKVNVGNVERWISIAGGAALIYRGLKRRSKGGALLAALGADLLYRGASGHSVLYQALGLSSVRKDRTSGHTIPYRQGIRVDEAVTIAKPVEEVYGFWRRLDNLPYFMEHLQSVSMIDEKRSRWITKAPAGKRVDWDAEIVSEVPNEMISWRSVPGSEIDSAGSVHFSPAPGDRGTEVRVELQYLAPGGALGAWFAKLLGEEPQQQIRDDLRHLKQLMETGEVPSTAGQPAGGERAGHTSAAEAW